MESKESARHDALPGVVAVGASAGGVEALTQFAAGLAPDLPYAVLIVLHMPPSAPSVLSKILDRSGPLPAQTAIDGVPMEPGRIYVCVPDRHLLAADGHVVLSQGPTENGHRPAINALFRSVALSFGPQAIGVLLSGVLDDGVLGAAAIRSRGGATVVQAPSDALFAAMPINAIEAGVADHQAAASDVGGVLTKLLEREIEVREMEPDRGMELENRIAMGRRFATSLDSEDLGPHSGYVCPDCNGSLIEVGPGSYRCRVGHAWTADALLKARDDEIEGAIWVALRSLREKAKMSRRLADTVGPGSVRQRYLATAEEADRAALVLGEHVSTMPTESPVSTDPTPLSVVAEPLGDVAMVRPRGVLDSSTYRPLRDTIIKTALEEPRAVVVDVNDLEVPAESALAVFTSARWHIGRWPEVPVVLVCKHRAMRAALARNGITRYVPCHATMQAAMDALTNGDSPRVRHRARAELPRTVGSLQRARELVVEWLTAWSQPELISTTKVVATTFVENVLQHTDSRPGLRIEARASTVTVAVTDSSHQYAVLREDSAHSPRPSGLRIIAALCRSWGNAPSTAGKTVWAVIGPENSLE